MRYGRFLKIALGIVGLVLAGSFAAEPATAQVYYYQCPPGYAYRVGYGCYPLSYFYGPPTYVYPGFGFNFFYGLGVNRGFHGHGHPARRGVHPGARPHGAHPGRH